MTLHANKHGPVLQQGVGCDKDIPSCSKAWSAWLAKVEIVQP